MLLVSSRCSIDDPPLAASSTTSSFSTSQSRSLLDFTLTIKKFTGIIGRLLILKSSYIKLIITFVFFVTVSLYWGLLNHLSLVSSNAAYYSSFDSSFFALWSTKGKVPPAVLPFHSPWTENCVQVLGKILQT